MDLAALHAENKDLKRKTKELEVPQVLIVGAATIEAELLTTQPQVCESHQLFNAQFCDKLNKHIDKYVKIVEEQQHQTSTVLQHTQDLIKEKFVETTHAVCRIINMLGNGLGAHAICSKETVHKWMDGKKLCHGEMRKAQRELCKAKVEKRHREKSHQERLALCKIKEVDAIGAQVLRKVSHFTTFLQGLEEQIGH
ncbi:hypothetical protein IE81DRAFT_331495 [Ceraceosorus guamensis]|uniref:Uncharacterized protein n=1 Tax=Ceraceosorus guamensis TaxID=1522189 RepID=A0A316VUR1_9BASI|nr:hypothetical protein IE81DRAFT_331495 [Ceraceosorus guamensis]PWN40638.1 hypothetical protein IE81DRAFT_331495 [Ceraceosorus guamensis]